MSWKIRWLSRLLLILPMTVSAYDDIFIDAVLNDSAKTVSGSVEVRFVDYAPGASLYLFRLYPNVKCTAKDSTCGLEVDSAWIDSVDVTSTLQHTGVYVSVTCPSTLRKHDTTKVRLKFTLNMSRPGYRTGFKRGQYLLEAWFPMPALWRDSNWVTTGYSEQAEPTADLFDITATLRLPDSLQYLAPSTQVLDTFGGASTYQTQLSGVDDIGAVIATGFLLDSSIIEGVSVSVWTREEDSWILPSARADVAASFSFMAGEGLPYPFPELVLVLGGLNMGGGLELPHMTVIMPPYRPNISYNYDETIIHETVHQWFYGLINSDQAADPWLDESITEYFSQRIMRSKFGANSLLDQFGFTASYESGERFSNRTSLELVPINRPAGDYFDIFEYYAAVYYKGAPTVAFLCGIMGKDNERKLWQDWVARYSNRMPSSDDFLTLAEQFLPKGHPGLAGRIIESTSRLDLAVNDVTSVPFDPADSAGHDSLPSTSRFTNTIDYTLQNHFDLPIPLRRWYADGTVIDTTLTASTGRHKLTLTADKPLRAATLDPDHIFCTDIAYLNNGRTVEDTRAASMRLFSGLTFLVQSLFSTIWGW